MANSVQSQIVANVVAALSGAGLSAFRCRFEPFTPPDTIAETAGDLPAVNVIPEDDVPDEEAEETWPVDARIFTFRARFSNWAVNAVDAAVDAQYVAGVKAILADPTLGGLARMTYAGERKWEEEPQGQHDIVTLTVLFTVKYACHRNDPSALVN